MIPVLICALISLSVAADNNLDSLYPELEHSRTIYVIGEYLCVCVSLCYNVIQSFAELGETPFQCPFLSFVHDTHSAVSFVSSVYQFVLPLWLADNAAMWGLLAQRDRVISSALTDENFVHVKISNIVRKIQLWY